MGLGDLVSSWGSTIGNAWGRITAGVSHIVDEVKHTGQQALDTAKSAVVTVYHDAKDAITGYGNIIGKVIDKGSQVIDTGIVTAGGTIKSLGDSLSMPLIVLGLGVAAFSIMKR